MCVDPSGEMCSAANSVAFFRIQEDRFAYADGAKE